MNVDLAHWLSWQERWDRQQEWYLPDREERFRDAGRGGGAGGRRAEAIDLACGTGSVSARLLRRFPGAVSTGVDLDPALAAQAAERFASFGNRRTATTRTASPSPSPGTWPPCAPRASPRPARPGPP